MTEHTPEQRAADLIVDIAESLVVSNELGGAHEYYNEAGGLFAEYFTDDGKLEALYRVHVTVEEVPKDTNRKLPNPDDVRRKLVGLAHQFTPDNRKPSVGRIVHYTNADGDTMPAIITEIFADNTVDLWIFWPKSSRVDDLTGFGFARALKPTPMHWNWPDLT